MRWLSPTFGAVNVASRDVALIQRRLLPVMRLRLDLSIGWLSML